MSARMFGIPNCDTVKKARTWVTSAGIEIEFHDFKKEGVTPKQIAGWLKHTDWEVLLNRRGTTWRRLPDAKKASVKDAASATALMLDMPSIIKRPVLECGKEVLVGFDSERYAALFKTR